MHPILNKLAGSDRRSIGRADEAIEGAPHTGSLRCSVPRDAIQRDPVIRMRAADVVEKVTQEQPELLEPYRDILLNDVARIEQQEVRWHVAQMLPRLEWSESARADVIELLLDYLADASRIVVTSAMQALAEFAERDPALRLQVAPILDELTRTGSPAMRARGRRSLERLGHDH